MTLKAKACSEGPKVCPAFVFQATMAVNLSKCPVGVTSLVVFTRRSAGEFVQYMQIEMHTDANNVHLNILRICIIYRYT